MKKILIAIFIAVWTLGPAYAVGGFYAANNQPFYPRNFIGLALWLDAASPSANGARPSAGAAIATWTDKSTAANNASQATGTKQATFNVNIQNGLPVLRFDGVDDYMVSAFNLNYTVNPNLTLFLVYQNRGAGTGGFLFGQDNGGFDRNLSLSYSGFPYSVYTGSSATAVPGLSTANVFKVVSLTLQNGVASGSTVHINNNLALTFSENHNTGEATTTLAALRASDGALPESIDLAEVIFYTRVLSASERLLVYLYLKNKWGTP